MHGPCSSPRTQALTRSPVGRRHEGGDYVERSGVGCTRPCPSPRTQALTRSPVGRRHEGGDYVERSGVGCTGRARRHGHKLSRDRQWGAATRAATTSSGVAWGARAVLVATDTSSHAIASGAPPRGRRLRRAEWRGVHGPCSSPRTQALTRSPVGRRHEGGDYVERSGVGCTGRARRHGHKLSRDRQWGAATRAATTSSGVAWGARAVLVATDTISRDRQWGAAKAATTSSGVAWGARAVLVATDTSSHAIASGAPPRGRRLRRAEWRGVHTGRARRHGHKLSRDRQWAPPRGRRLRRAEWRGVHGPCPSPRTQALTRSPVGRRHEGGDYAA